MAIDPVTAVLEIGSKVIDKLWPDPVQRDAAKLELLKMQQSGELQKLASETELAKSQIEVNQEEAKSSSLFVSGWRPAAGWVCVIGLAYTFFLRPLMVFAIGFIDVPAGSPPITNPPELDMGELITLLFGMLGLGTIRMQEKLKWVASK